MVGTIYALGAICATATVCVVSSIHIQTKWLARIPQDVDIERGRIVFPAIARRACPGTLETKSRIRVVNTSRYSAVGILRNA